MRKRLTHPRWNIIAGDNLVRIFSDRLHQIDHIQYLETPLFGFFDRLLPSDHQHRHAAKLGIGRCSSEISRARAQSGKANSGLAGKTTISRSHETGCLLMAGQHQLDFFGSRQAIEKIQIFLARNAEKYTQHLLLLMLQ